MPNHPLFYIIIAILLAQYLMDTILDFLNAKKYADPIPEELHDVFDADEYQKSQAYKKDNYRFGRYSDTFNLIVTILFLVFGGFEWIDTLVRTLTESQILQALFFFGILALGSNLLGIPFSYYQTFVIEERYNFNKTTIQTFCADIVKVWLLIIVLGGIIMVAIIWFFQQAGSNFWLYAWGILSLIMIFFNLFYSKLIVPLFNKQTPLQSGNLKSAIENYAQKVGFELENIFVIDGSKRSTKSNAYFSGFGKQKRITIFDTLLNNLEEDEIVAVLAHEVGHYKRNHILVNLFASIVLTGTTLYILSLFVNNPEMSMAIGVGTPSFHAAMIGFVLLYSPISELTGLAMNFLSRKFEFQADDYAKETYGPQPLITSLKKLSKSSLSNLTPHPAYVFMNYSHPPLIQRIRNLKA